MTAQPQPRPYSLDTMERLVTDLDRAGHIIPEPPANVRIVYADGRSVPCPVKYLGYREFGYQLGKCFGWRVLNEGPFDSRQGDRIEFTGGTSPIYVECPGNGTPDQEPT